MATILLYSASIFQTSSQPPTANDDGRQLISGSWSRLNTGSYKFTRTSGLYFTPSSGSIDGTLIPTLLTNSTSSINMYLSGSDSSSLYLNTYLPSNNTYTLADNMLQSSSIFQINISIEY